ncbi:MAG: hypothetical protein U9N42_06985 [Campylobacterota bacterium]|nr:hypothetical protein [Campylobacterota bacterium]
MSQELLEDKSVTPWFEKNLGLTLNSFIIAIVFVVASGVYIGVLLFGDNSLEVYMNLEEYEYKLSNKISNIKKENSLLQKEYFELRELDIDYNREKK